MAFFKFRLPGQTASAEAVNAAPSESIEVVRRRARHRLIGAVVLVLVAVVGFPLLFDTQPRPVAVDTPIVIPDRQSTPSLASGTPVPAALSPAKPLLPAPEAVTAQASLGDREEVVPPSPAASAAAKTESAKPETAKADAAKPEPGPEPTKPAPAAEKPQDKADKAQALLDGKTEKDAATNKPKTPKLIIQVGAFAEKDKVREVRSKLEKAGYKTYTQVIERDGKSTTRIRVGPYETREDADKVAARIRKLDLPATVLKI
jgi:DedD protein